MKKKQRKIILVAVLISLSISLSLIFYSFDLISLLSFSNIKEQQESIAHYYSEHSVSFPILFFAIYVLMAAISFPGATVMTLLAGALFGLAMGSIIVSFASSLGATVAFLMARYLLQERLLQHYSDKLHKLNQGITREGGYYLFTLRLVPVFPFFMVNWLMGLTTIRLRTYYCVSQIGMLPATLIYVNAGTQLAQLESASGILSTEILCTLLLLGFFPIIVKKLLPQQAVHSNHNETEQT